MDLGKVAIGVGLVGAVGVAGFLLAGCNKNPNEFAMDEFGTFDDRPKDNNWTPNELEKSWIHTRTQEVNTYRIGDYIHGTRQILQHESTDSMRRIFEAARGNDAVLSLDELTNFAVTRFDADKDGQLSSGERGDFNRAYGVATTRTRDVLIGQEPFMRYSPRNDYPAPNYPGTGGQGPTSPGDDGGQGPTSPGDDGGAGWPSNPGNPGNPGLPSGGDDNGSGVPSNPGNGGNGNSTDNGNPNEGDF